MINVKKSWPHAPLHSFNETGTYMVTGATLNKIKYFKEKNELDLLQDLLLELADQYKWRLEAWAIFPNHYHMIAHSSEESTSLGKFIRHLYASSARKLNEMHQNSGRKIWYQYWDSRITFQNSYLARLNYVMQNPVKHKVVENSNEYRWCSANWFETSASKAYVEIVKSLNTDTVNIGDDY